MQLWGSTNDIKCAHFAALATLSVLLYVPLWEISCLELETNMGNLVKLVSSSNGIPFQMLKRMLLMSNFNQVLSMASEEIDELYSQTKTRERMGVKILGRPQMPSRNLAEFVSSNNSGVQRIEGYSHVCVWMHRP